MGRIRPSSGCLGRMRLIRMSSILRLLAARLIWMAAVCLLACRIVLVRSGGRVARRLAFAIRIRGGCMLRRGCRRAARLLRRHGRRLIRRACRLRCYCTLPAEYAGLGGGRDRGASVICGCEVLFVLAGNVFVMRLRGKRFPVVLVLRDFFFVGGTGPNSALAAIESHVILVHDHSLVIDVGHIGDVGRRAVVVERASAPFSARKADAAVAEAVVHSPIEADVRAPITTMPSIDRKSTRLNSSHLGISYAVFCLK